MKKLINNEVSANLKADAQVNITPIKGEFYNLYSIEVVMGNTSGYITTRFEPTVMDAINLASRVGKEALSLNSGGHTDFKVIDHPRDRLDVI